MMQLIAVTIPVLDEQTHRCKNIPAALLPGLYIDEAVRLTSAAAAAEDRPAHIHSLCDRRPSRYSIIMLKYQAVTDAQPESRMNRR